MARTDVNAVRAIIDTKLEESQIENHIETANLMVNTLLADEGYSSGLLTEIEKWLAAHYVATQDPRRRAENLGDLNVTYEGRSGGTPLEQTRYGQQVLMLDHHGVFANASKAKGQIKFKAT
ncbi:MAG: DUF4054 domain-containing protein [Candidatus Zixiibacteriota bacterium]|nr:MAG: DUF4054 domain-containing protein [candidate division Zixibacteria bacterium]